MSDLSPGRVRALDLVDDGLLLLGRSLGHRSFAMAVAMVAL